MDMHLEFRAVWAGDRNLGVGLCLKVCSAPRTEEITKAVIIRGEGKPVFVKNPDI